MSLNIIALTIFAHLFYYLFLHSNLILFLSWEVCKNEKKNEKPKKTLPDFKNNDKKTYSSEQVKERERENIWLCYSFVLWIFRGILVSHES